MLFGADKLRQDIMDYYGTAMASGNPMAMMDLIRVEQAGSAELASIAAQNGFSLTHYEKE